MPLDNANKRDKQAHDEDVDVSSCNISSSRSVSWRLVDTNLRLIIYIYPLRPEDGNIYNWTDIGMTGMLYAAQSGKNSP